MLDGFLYSHKLAAGSRRQITSFFVPGDIADLNTLYLPSVDYGITSLGSAVVAFVSHAALKEMLDRSPSLTRAFWRESLMQAAIWHEWVTNLGRRDALARIAHVLCELTLRLQLAGLAREQSFSMPCTQVDIADACGISSVHANRIIQELRQLHVVEWDSRRVRILDWLALARLGDFSGSYLQLKQPAPDRKQAPPSGQGVPEWI
ncbi:Crp/Fnr family transcriptional regulator [Bradyrhizobium diazoefficiens]|uniref:Crp/Fnr family transcriptional regulator n=1 Tax=Bradyrhizobium diazoefficiens TaxID=1355477 RepID=UPI001FEDC616|nr:Crp/Fnr family transcriptional regulator [Bradyrhizobium diazoefficiens]